MPDHLTPDQRHKNMVAIRAQNTMPETEGVDNGGQYLIEF